MQKTLPTCNKRDLLFLALPGFGMALNLVFRGIFFHLQRVVERAIQLLYRQLKRSHILAMTLKVSVASNLASSWGHSWLYIHNQAGRNVLSRDRRRDIVIYRRQVSHSCLRKEYEQIGGWTALRTADVTINSVPLRWYRFALAQSPKCSSSERS